MPSFNTPKLNHLIFIQNCKNILIYGISFSSLSFSNNRQTPPHPIYPHSYPVFWDKCYLCYNFTNISDSRLFIQHWDQLPHTHFPPIVNRHCQMTDNKYGLTCSTSFMWTEWHPIINVPGASNNSNASLVKMGTNEYLHSNGTIKLRKLWKYRIL